MPAAYPPGDDASQAAERSGAWHENQNGHQSRQDSSMLRNRPSLADISRGLRSRISSIWRRDSDVRARDQEENVESNIEAPQGTVGVPYENHIGEDGQRLGDGWVVFIRQTIDNRAHRWSGSRYVTRQLTIKRTRNQTTPPDEAAEAETEARTPLLRQSDGEAQPHEELLQSVPMERSYAQSRWGRLKGQISLPNLRSAAKRKHSAQDGEHSFRVKRVTLMHPPDHTTRVYQQAVNDEDMAEAGPSNTRSPRASARGGHFSRYLTTGDPYSGMFEMDGEPEENVRVDSHRIQPVLPRAVHLNNAALDALEGKAAYDDGSNWDPNNPNLPADMAWVHRQFLDMNSPSELDHFTKEQRKTFCKYVEEAEQPDGFEYEEMDTTEYAFIPDPADDHRNLLTV